MNFNCIFNACSIAVYFYVLITTYQMNAIGKGQDAGPATSNKGKGKGPTPIVAQASVSVQISKDKKGKGAMVLDIVCFKLFARPFFQIYILT